MLPNGCNHFSDSDDESESGGGGGGGGDTATLSLAGVAPDETVILLHPPSTFSRCINRDGEGASAK